MTDFSEDVAVRNGSFGGDGAEGSDGGQNSKSNEDRKIFIGGLSWETDEAQLKQYFEKFGEVESVNLKLNPMTGKSRCFAFVVFKDATTVPLVMDAGEHAINSKKVDVKKAKAKPGKIFVGGLKPEMTDEDIREAFAKFGTIIEFDMPYDKIRKARKGFGFITFEREETMKELIKMGKVSVGEHKVDLRKATPRQDFGGAGGAPGANGAGWFQGGGAGAVGGYGDYYGSYGGSGAGDYYSGYYNYGGSGAAGGSWMGGYGNVSGGGGGKMGRGGAGAPRRGGRPY